MIDNKGFTYAFTKCNHFFQCVLVLLLTSCTDLCSAKLMKRAGHPSQSQE